MLPIVQQPRLNPVNFIPNIEVVDTRIHTQNWLSEWFYDRLQAWQDKTPYLTPFQFNDRVRLQLNSSSDDAVSLQVLDCTGIVKAQIFPTIYDIPGNNDKDTGTHLYNCYFRFTFSGIAGLQPGTYYLLFNAGTDDAKVQMVSEPIQVATDFPNTLLFQYRNNTNDYDCIFEQTNCIFSLRVPGIVGDPNPDFDYNSYKDQRNNTTRLSGEPGRTFEYFFEKISPQAHDTLNHALVCDYVQAEDTQVAMDDSSKWDDGTTPGAALRSPSIILRESDPSRNSTYRPADDLVITTFPSTTPYYVFELRMGQNTPNISLPTRRFITSNLGDLTAYIGELNAAAPSLDLAGTFSAVSVSTGYQIIYSNGPGEYYNVGSSQVLPPTVSLTVTTTAAQQSFSFQFTQGLIGVVWGDGSNDAYLAFSGFTAAIHQYATAGTRTVYILGSYVNLYMTVTSTARYLTAVSGLFPNTLKELKIQGSNITSFNFDTLSRVVNTVTTVQITDGILASVPSYPNYAWTKLLNLSVSGNVLNVANVSNLIVGVYNNSLNQNLSNGALSTVYQRPTATPNFNGQIAANNLRGRGWEVNTD